MFVASTARCCRRSNCRPIFGGSPSRAFPLMPEVSRGGGPASSVPRGEARTSAAEPSGDTNRDVQSVVCVKWKRGFAFVGFRHILQLRGSGSPIGARQKDFGGRSVPNTIALVDDDRNILASVSMALEAEGFAVRCYSDGTEALKGLSAPPVDIAVLDIKMPRMDGMELLGQLRRQSHIPVIFLTSKDDEVDELLGLRMGADDYIRKPFSQRLLIERIRALTRRGKLARELENSHGEPVVVRGQLILDPARHLCTWKSEHVELTVTEFLILKSLAHRPGRGQS